MEQTKFSVIIPLYNKEHYIQRTIDSVLNQNYQNFEIIIVNDGSTDNSLDIVQAIDSDKIVLLNKPNGGESSARNEGIKRARGEYVCFLDGDDQYLSNHLETLNRLINAFPREVLFSTNYYNKYPHSDNRILAFDIYHKEGVINDYFLESQKVPLVTSNTACIKRDVFGNLGVFDEELKFGPDLDMWFRIALNHNLVFSHIPTAIYNRDADNRVMNDYHEFNDAIIDKLTSYLSDFNNSLSARSYIESNIIKQIKYHLLKGNNSLVRRKLKKYKENIKVKKFYIYTLFSLLPVQKIKSIIKF